MKLAQQIKRSWGVDARAHSLPLAPIPPAAYDVAAGRKRVRRWIYHHTDHSFDLIPVLLGPWLLHFRIWQDETI